MRTALGRPVSDELHYHWEWHFKANPDTMWPYFADTNRFNYDRGNPGLQHFTPGGRQPNAHRRLGFSVKGLPQLWDEEPFEWVRPFRHSVRRHFLSGFMEDLRLEAELLPADDGGSVGTYDTYVTPRGWLGRLIVPWLVGKLTYDLFDKAFQKYDKLSSAGDRSVELQLEGRITFPPGGLERLEEYGKDLAARGPAPDLVRWLIDLLKYADDLALARLRPYTLADAWEINRKEVLELFLLATRVGLLEFRWEILCPLCRGAKDYTESLAELRQQVHCNTCNIDYTANFEQSVELTFHPNPSVRSWEANDFCVAGPQVTPHIVAQQLMKPAERRDISLPLEAGRYRLRALELRGGQLITAESGGMADVTLPVNAAGWPSDELAMGLQPTLRLSNNTSDEQLVILERMAWSDEAVIASEVFTMQKFRDLFANEALRPGEQVTVGSMTIAFTDLRESTRMYREIGDARAFGLVMSHFDVLKEIIDRHDGAVVKTIGDSVMAVFRRPTSAVQAMLSAQMALADPSSPYPLSLRVGIHYGPCVAVNLNDRLDYFGSTVNIAARLEALSTGSELVISGAVHRDPEVQALLGELAGNVMVEGVEATLKGFETERFDLFLVAPKIRFTPTF